MGSTSGTLSPKVGKGSSKGALALHPSLGASDASEREVARYCGWVRAWLHLHSLDRQADGRQGVLADIVLHLTGVCVWPYS